MSKPRKRKPFRKGIATVEMVFCFPIVIAITIGTIDLCGALFLKESLTIAAYEGARVGVPAGGTDVDARNRVLELLDSRGVIHDGETVKISKTGFDSAKTLEHVTLTVSVPAAGNLLSATQFFHNKRISASVVMRKEYQAK